MIDRGLRSKLKNPQFSYIAPNYGQAKRVAWEPLKEFCKNIPNIVINEADLRIDIPRGHPFSDKVRIMLLGAENPGSIKGIYLDGAILDEFAECDPIIWSQVVRPALSDRKGWAIFVGTPKGQNHFYDVLKLAQKTPEHWFWAIYKASETGVIPKEELAMAKLEMSPEEYEQEFECSFTAALIGAYYGKQMEEAEVNGRIRSVPHDLAVLTDTFWDLGVGDTTAIWFIQSIGKEFHAVDYYEMSGKGLDHYAKILKDRPYVYGRHVVPHDAAARELGTGKSRVETLLNYGIRVEVLPRENVDDGIHAARQVLPKVWFDAVKCQRGIDVLKNYSRKWDAKNKIFSDSPHHNWASHGADAFRSFAMGARSQSKDFSHLPREADRSYDIFGDGN